jgi:hypothetical protein
VLDFFLIFILVGALALLSTFGGFLGIMAFAAGVVAAIITMLLRLHAKLDILYEKLEEKKKEEP